MYLALALGVLATYITSLLKKWKPDLEARAIQLAVLAVCFVIALAVTVVAKYAPAELLATLGTSFATAIAWYEIAVKKR